MTESRRAFAVMGSGGGGEGADFLDLESVSVEKWRSGSEESLELLRALTPLISLLQSVLCRTEKLCSLAK